MNGTHGDKSLDNLLRPRVKRWPTPDPRTDTLVTAVLQLMMEVEALREALINLEGGRKGNGSVYGRAYRETAYLTHNSAGPTSGLAKLIAQFQPSDVEQHPGDPEPRAWTETQMLRRLGFSEEDIGAYRKEALEAEMFT
jgi:hypothetical protein